MEDICLQTLILLFKYANDRNKSFVSTAIEALVGTLMTIDDVNDILLTKGWERFSYTLNTTRVEYGLVTPSGTKNKNSLPCHKQTLAVWCSSTISKTRASVSSGYPNTEKQMKAQGRRPSAFIVSRCLHTPMKHEPRVLEITSHDHSQTNHKQRLPIRIVCYLTFLPG